MPITPSSGSQSHADSHLVKTGYPKPQGGVQQSLWMATWLSQNLCTRFPVGIDESSISHCKPGYVFALPTNYRWDGVQRSIRCIALLEAYIQGVEVYLGGGGIYQVVGNESLALTIGGISDDDLGRLVELREKIVQVEACPVDTIRAAM